MPVVLYREKAKQNTSDIFLASFSVLMVMEEWFSIFCDSIEKVFDLFSQGSSWWSAPDRQLQRWKYHKKAHFLMSNKWLAYKGLVDA